MTYLWTNYSVTVTEHCDKIVYSCEVMFKNEMNHFFSEHSVHTIFSDSSRVKPWVLFYNKCKKNAEQ